MTKLAFEFEMKPWQAGDTETIDSRPWRIAISAKPVYHHDGSIDQITVEAICPDGVKRELMIEIADGDLVAHCYDAGHENPLSLFIGKTQITTSDENDRNNEEAAL